MTRTLGIIGSGQVGSTVARLAVDAGWRVVLSNSRGADTLAELVAELGSRASAASPADAAAAGDLVVTAAPLAALDKLPRDALADKVVIDTMNYTTERDGHIAELDTDERTSSEYVQRQLTGSSVVKAFNNITTRHLMALARPAGDPDRSALPIAGDDTVSKDEVVDLIDALGYDTVDIGDLTESWRFSPNTLLYALAYGGEEIPAGLSGAELLVWFAGTAGKPLRASQVKRLADEAVRGPAALSLSS